MKKLKVKEKMKRLFLIVITFVTIVFMMPVNTKAGIITDFIDLILHIPDGCMHIIDHYLGGSREFTYENLDFKRMGWSRCYLQFYSNSVRYFFIRYV